jgi:hypothetical protein
MTQDTLSGAREVLAGVFGFTRAGKRHSETGTMLDWRASWTRS